MRSYRFKLILALIACLISTTALAKHHHKDLVLIQQAKLAKISALGNNEYQLRLYSPQDPMPYISRYPTFTSGELPMKKLIQYWQNHHHNNSNNTAILSNNNLMTTTDTKVLGKQAIVIGKPVYKNGMVTYIIKPSDKHHHISSGFFHNITLFINGLSDKIKSAVITLGESSEADVSESHQKTDVTHDKTTQRQ